MTEPAPAARHAFIVSDRTGITAENLAHSLLCHFPGVPFTTTLLAFVDTVDKAIEAARRVNEAAVSSGSRPVIFATLSDTALRETLAGSQGVLFDLFDAFLAPLERELGVPSSHSVGSSHGVLDPEKYTRRIGAINFSLRFDDGADTSQYNQAQVILVGVSRSGKTPTSLYLALHYGILAANYPLTGEELERERLPEHLQPFKDKLFGLSIDPDRLQQIRLERYSGGRYATPKQCQFEVTQAENIFRNERVPFVNTTAMSVEEIAASILHQRGLKPGG